MKRIEETVKISDATTGAVGKGKSGCMVDRADITDSKGIRVESKGISKCQTTGRVKKKTTGTRKQHTSTNKRKVCGCKQNKGTQSKPCVSG